MKKLLLMVILLFLGFTACTYEDENQETGLAPLLQVENDSGLYGVLTFSNGFGVGFMFRNETGMRLYYNDDFRVNSAEMTNRHNRAGTQFINIGDTKEAHVNWSDPLETGMYNFERDFFIDEDLTELYTTLEFLFDVIGWYHFTDDAEPAPEELLAIQQARIDAHRTFLIEGGPSDIIILASEVAVSRTAIAFSTANISAVPYMHGSSFRLFIYENGWKDAPVILDSWAFTDEGFGIKGGEVIDDHINFEWLYGELVNGRYMFIRNHFEDHGQPGAPRIQQELIIEFEINDSTPVRLE